MAEEVAPHRACPPLLELRGIRKEFPGVLALDHVYFDLEPGEIHALCGENGAGKSTLIKVLCGCFPAGTFDGEILLEGRTARFRTLRAAEQHGIALIAQELALVPELSVEENLVLGREPARFGLLRREAVRDEARRALDRVGLEVDPARPIKELGIGQQQMVEIAKALAKRAAILVLDEPTASLSGNDSRRLMGLLAELKGRGISAVYVSHRLEEVFEIADRITVLRDGRAIGTARASGTTRERVISLMVGRDVKDLYPRPPLRRSDVRLEVRGWTLEDPANPGRRVLEDIGFDVRAGEVLGIAGLMGAGRTALLSSLFGAARSRVHGELALEAPGTSAGSPRGLGRTLLGTVWRRSAEHLARTVRGPFRTPAEAIAAGLMLVSEDRKRYGLVPEMSVVDNLTLATLARFRRRGLLDGRARERACLANARSLHLKVPTLAAAVATLSGGNQQKVVLGRWLMAGPRVLLLDEPTRGIDIGAKAEIYRLITDLAGRGLAVVIVSSDLPELLGLSHRVLVLSQGRRAALLEGDAATPERVMAAATAKVRA